MMPFHTDWKPGLCSPAALTLEILLLEEVLQEAYLQNIYFWQTEALKEVFSIKIQIIANFSK